MQRDDRARQHGRPDRPSHPRCGPAGARVRREQRQLDGLGHRARRRRSPISRPRPTSSSSRSPTASVVEAVVYGPGGLLEATRSGQDRRRPEHVCAAPRRRGSMPPSRERSVEFVDAGISGGAAAAEKGALSIMAGGSEEALARVHADPRDLQHARLPHGPVGLGARRQAPEQLPERDQPCRDRRGDGRRQARRPRPGPVPRRRQPLERRQLRDPEPLPADRRGRLPRGRPHERPDGQGHQALPRVPAADRASRASPAPACLGAFNLATSLGYGDQISNRVVDAIGDVAGGVRIQAKGGRA